MAEIVANHITRGTATHIGGSSRGGGGGDGGGSGSGSGSGSGGGGNQC